MKFYDAVGLSNEEKKELCLVISETHSSDITLHPWILGDLNTFNLIYVKPEDRQYYIDGGNQLKTTNPTTVIDIWGLVALLGDTRLPVHGFELISRLNDIAAVLDIKFKEKQ